MWVIVSPRVGRSIVAPRQVRHFERSREISPPPSLPRVGRSSVSSRYAPCAPLGMTVLGFQVQCTEKQVHRTVSRRPRPGTGR